MKSFQKGNESKEIVNCLVLSTLEMLQLRSVTEMRSPHAWVVMACFLATLIAYVERTGFSIAYTAIAKESGTSEGTTGAILSSFYWGYGLSQVPGGLAAHRFGGERMLTISYLLWSLASFATPASGSQIYRIIVARFFVGTAQGLLIPSVHTVLSKWIPPTERAKAVSLTTSGMYLGSATAMLVLPTVVARFGPAALLRLVGGMGMAWVLLWRAFLLMGHRTRSSMSMPVHMKTIISHDRPAAGHATASSKNERLQPMPWSRIISHPAVWAIIINNYAFHYAFYVVMNWLPTYFAEMLRTNLALLGPVKALPYVTMFVTSNLGGWVGDWLVFTKKRSIAGGRKIVNSLGFWIGSCSLVLMPYMTSVRAGVLCTTCALGACGFARGGFSVNHMDIAPKYAGIIM